MRLSCKWSCLNQQVNFIWTKNFFNGNHWNVLSRSHIKSSTTHQKSADTVRINNSCIHWPEWSMINEIDFFPKTKILIGKVVYIIAIAVSVCLCDGKRTNQSTLVNVITFGLLFFKSHCLLKFKEISSIVRNQN